MNFPHKTKKYFTVKFANKKYIFAGTTYIYSVKFRIIRKAPCKIKVVFVVSC